MRAVRALFVASMIASVASVVACGWSPSRPFEREAPEVREAIVELEAGKPKEASSLLGEYLATGACDQGRIGTPPRVRERPNGSFDLGLAFFSVAEAYGQRFSDGDGGGGGGGAASQPASVDSTRGDTISCALQIVRAVAEDASQPAELRARARYVEGNLLLFNGNFEDAVKAYEHALAIAPGMHTSGPSGASDAGKPYEPDAIGRDAAWNRAIALRRKDDEKSDAGQDGGSDGGDGGRNDGGGRDRDGGRDGGDGNDGDGGGGGRDGGGDGGGTDEEDAGSPPPQPERADAGPPPPASQDERILDQLENATTVQQEAAKKRAGKGRPVRGSADK